MSAVQEYLLRGKRRLSSSCVWKSIQSPFSIAVKEIFAPISVGLLESQPRKYSLSGNLHRTLQSVTISFTRSAATLPCRTIYLLESRKITRSRFVSHDLASAMLSQESTAQAWSVVAASLQVKYSARVSLSGMLTLFLLFALLHLLHLHLLYTGKAWFVEDRWLRNGLLTQERYRTLDTNRLRS